MARLPLYWVGGEERKSKEEEALCLQWNQNISRVTQQAIDEASPILATLIGVI